MKKFQFFLFAMMVMALSTSCGSDDDSDNEGGKGANTAQQISNRALLNYWACSGSSNSVPAFFLYSDGTCFVTVSASDFTGEWAYDANTKVLVITGFHNYSFTIKLLTNNKLSAEWTTAKGVTRTDTWSAYTAYSQDPAWESLINGTWTTNAGESFTAKDGKFSLTLCDASDAQKTVSITGSYKKSNERIELTSDEELTYLYYDDITKSTEVAKKRVSLYIAGLTGSVISIYTPKIRKIEGVSLQYPGVGSYAYYLNTFFYQY